MADLERQLEQAANDRNHKNILAVKQHSEVTREGLRDAEIEVANLRNDVIAANNRISGLETQIKGLLVKVYSGA